jgi:D-alanyl-lipoteichoic acid acyltransferase DltB (MBOAT superfamily)
VLLAASYWFYAAWDYRFLTLIWISTVVDYVVGLRLAATRTSGSSLPRRLWLSMSLVTNLGLLGFFKYYGFFVESAADLLNGFGLGVSASTLSIVLPVGISFYTFQTLSYTIDIWRNKLDPTRNLVDFALFVAFFPQLVAHLNRGDVSAGLYLILVGLVRKVVIADTAGLIADRYFSDPGAYGTVELIAGVMLYALQIYGDFAGYSNIARGSARLLGFDLMRNFRHPYFAASVTEFWQRWHISLSTWLRDYLYIPLGGNRLGQRRTYINLMATMLLGGLWHGASWNFVVWGGLHGIYLAGHRLVTARRVANGLRVWSRAAGVAATFPLVAVTWLTFRLTDMSAVGDYVQGMTRLAIGDLSALFPVVVLGALALLIDLPQHQAEDEFVVLRRAPAVRGALAGAAVVLIILSGGGLDAPFIYFQF